jgi:hypothetical protein
MTQEEKDKETAESHCYEFLMQEPWPDMTAGFVFQKAFLKGILHERGKAKEPGEAQEGKPLPSRIFVTQHDINKHRLFDIVMPPGAIVYVPEAALSFERSLVSSLKKELTEQDERITAYDWQQGEDAQTMHRLSSEISELQKKLSEEATAGVKILLKLKVAEEALEKALVLAERMEKPQTGDWRKFLASELVTLLRQGKEKQGSGEGSKDGA